MVLPEWLFGPEATVEMRVGGRFEVCMRSPEGMEHWTKGTFTEVVAPERLTIDHHVIDPCGGGRNYPPPCHERRSLNPWVDGPH